MNETERAKGAIHAVAGSLAFAMGLWNLMRYMETRHPRNAINVAVYSAAWLFEGVTVWEHWSQRP